MTDRWVPDVFYQNTELGATTACVLWQGAVPGMARSHTVYYLGQNNVLSLGFYFIYKIKGMDPIDSSNKRFIRVFEIESLLRYTFFSFLVTGVTIITRGESVQKALPDS